MAAMEDVLTVYQQPYDEDYPQVCLDEKLVTLHEDVVAPLPVRPGYPQRVDYEYERVGTANLFVVVERLSGYRHVAVTERRTAVDYAHQLQWLADVRYPNAKKSAWCRIISIPIVSPTCIWFFLLRKPGD